MHKNYINVLKQWHTLLRFLDYLHLETEKEFNKVRAELTEGQIGWNSEAEKLWNDQFLGKSHQGVSLFLDIDFPGFYVRHVSGTWR